MEDPKIKIGFSFEDEFGNSYEAASKVEVFESLGETELSAIGERLNIFLKQIGFVRKNDNIFMEDLTDDEFEAISDYLHELRDQSEGEENT